MGGEGAAFPLTSLSLLLRAGTKTPEGRKQALDILLGSYWKPLYAWLRAGGSPDAEAKDAVQGFYVELLDKGTLARFDPARGRFRTFLLACLRGHVSHTRDREGAQKRGGGRKHVAADAVGDEAVDQGPSPEQAYDRAWALGLMERAFARWRDRLRQAGKGQWLPLIDLLEAQGLGSLPPVAELAKQLGVTEAQVRHFLNREARTRLREDVLAEVREGTSNDAEAEDELQHLMACLGRV